MCACLREDMRYPDHRIPGPLSESKPGLSSPAPTAFGPLEASRSRFTGREHVRPVVCAVSSSTAHPSAEAWPSASPSAPRDVLVLADATQLRIRLVERRDRAGLAGLFARLSSTSRYRRYLSPKHELTPAELTELTDLDHVTHEAIAAVDQSTGAIIGVARYAQQADRIGVAEMAVEVADESHNMGIGTALAELTVQRARANGFTLLTASALWENRPARSILRRLGFRALASSGSVIELQLALEPADRSGWCELGCPG